MKPVAAVLRIAATIFDRRIRGSDYPRVVIRRGKGEIVMTGKSTGPLYIYPSILKRIMYRRLRYGRHVATFYWSDGAWASVIFDSVDELQAVLSGKFAKIFWPHVTPEAI